MAKLTESYLRNMIKQVLKENVYDTDLPDEVSEIGTEEFERADEHEEILFDCHKQIQNAIDYIEEDDSGMAIRILKGVLLELEQEFRYSAEQSDKLSSRAASMQRTAMKTGFVPGILGPESDPHFGQAIGESRKKTTKTVILTHDVPHELFPKSERDKFKKGSRIQLGGQGGAYMDDQGNIMYKMKDPKTNQMKTIKVAGSTQYTELGAQKEK